MNKQRYNLEKPSFINKKSRKFRNPSPNLDISEEFNKQTDHIGGVHASLSNFSQAGKAVCNKLREFTSKITK